MRTRGRARARRAVAGGEQISLPCRYCGTTCEMAKHLIEELLSISAKTIEKRGEPPIQKNEIAVCVDCRPRYEAEFCPDTVTITVRKANVDSAFTPEQDDSSDGFGPPDQTQKVMGL